MVDIQSVMAEIRQGKKEEKQNKLQDENMSASASQCGHNKAIVDYTSPTLAHCTPVIPFLADPICIECASDGMIPSAV